MPKVVYNSAQGLVQQAGSGIELNTNSFSITALPVSPVQAITTTGATIAAPGVYTVAGGGALTTTVPDPSSVPGGTVIVRSLSNHAHVLTGSAAVAGVNIFRSSPMTTANVVGQSITFAATAGNTVTLISDGLAFCIAAGSGSIGA